jgi:general secretion pathway protein G
MSIDSAIKDEIMKYLKLLLSTIIIGYILMICCCSTSDTSKYKYTKTQINLFEEALERFNVDVGRYPSTDEGLEALRSNVGNYNKWLGPYVNKSIPRDAYGTNYVYIYPPMYGNKNYDLYSFGQDLKDDFGAHDDISNWRDTSDKYDNSYHVLISLFAVVVALVLYIVFNVVRRKMHPLI